MRPKPIGIVGGAGPLAGALLLERVLRLAGERYGCSRDADFPEVMLLSYPFSEMLIGDVDQMAIRQELKTCLTRLQNGGASILVIACNTLHAFLDEEVGGLIHLPKVIARALDPGTIPLVLCTTTSARFALHQRFFPCRYPTAVVQEKVDWIINQILQGACEEAMADELMTLLDGNTVLGCTELSMLAKYIKVDGVIDPVELAALEIVEKSFGGCDVINVT